MPKGSVLWLRLFQLLEACWISEPLEGGRKDGGGQEGVGIHLKSKPVIESERSRRKECVFVFKGQSFSNSQVYKTLLSFILYI